MNIAIDGRAMTSLVGKGVYSKSVVGAWRDFSGHNFHVFGYQPPAGELWPSNWQFTPIISWSQRLQAFRRLREDVLFSPISYVTTILSNRPTLTTIHDLVAYKVPVKLPLKTVVAEKFLLGRAVKKSAALTTQSQSTKRDLVEYFPAAAAKTTVVPPGVAAAVRRDILPDPAEQQTILNHLGINKKYGLFVGTLEPRKNIVRLVRAYEQLPSECRSQYQLVLAGQAGWANRELKTVLDHSPAGLVVTGRVSDEILATLYQHSEAIVYPSLYEGVGYPILEGYYWNKPVLTSNTSSMAEVGQGATLLVEPTSIESIQAGLEQLFTDQNRRQSLVAAGQAKLGEFSWAAAAERYLAILTKIS